MNNKNYNKHTDFSFFNVFLIVLLILALIGFIGSDFKVDTTVFDKLFKNEQGKTEKEPETLVKQLYCQYDGSISFENSVGGLKIYVPTYEGYINYNIVHTQNQNDYKDVWRIGQAYALDDNLQNSYAITGYGSYVKRSPRFYRRSCSR